jgi:2-methylcitrate dehydratase PrpD
MADETRQLAQFVANLTYEQIPQRVRVRAIQLLTDQLGVQVGCSEMPWAKQIRNVYRRTRGKPESTVIRYGDRLPADATAFINSAFGHSFEYDDANALTHGHTGAELIPALMAIAEREHISGKELLTTFVAAYEVRGRIGWALSPDLATRGGPQYSVTCGPFGAAAGVARLLKMDADGIRHAMAIAGCYAGGLAQYDHGGGSCKRIFTAIATDNGMRAAFLAQGGITGPEEILEGPHGLLKIYSEDQRPQLLVAELGQRWTIDNATFKPYCCCAVIHPAIDGMRKLVVDHGLRADDIESVEVSYAAASYQHAAITDPKDLLGMQFSTAYSLALTVLKERNTPKQYTLAALKDPAVRAFATKVSIQRDDSLGQYYETHRPARVKARTRSGVVHETLIMDAKGTAAVPFSSDDVDEKFRSQVAEVVGAERCEALLRALHEIDTLDDVADLLPLLVLPKRTRRKKVSG